MVCTGYSWDVLRCINIFQYLISNDQFCQHILRISVKSFWGGCLVNIDSGKGLVSSAVTGVNINTDPFHHMASPGYNDIWPLGNLFAPSNPLLRVWESAGRSISSTSMTTLPVTILYMRDRRMSHLQSLSCSQCRSFSSCVTLVSRE